MAEREGLPRRASSVVLAALQGNGADEEVVSLACDEARRRGGRVEGLYVVEIPPALPLATWNEEAEERAQLALNSAREVCMRMGCRLDGQVMPTRDAAQAIIDEAAEIAADVVVLANPLKSRRQGAAWHVVDRAVSAVLLWRPGR